MTHTMDWQKRLFEHEASPPPGAWEAIREEIRSHPAVLGKKLEAMEAQPPAEAWDSIRKELGMAREEDANKIPVRGTVRSRPDRAFAYAASIAGIGLFLSLAYWYKSGPRNEGTLLGGASPIENKVETNGPKPKTAIEEAGMADMEAAVSDSVFPLRFTQVRRSPEPGKIELCDGQGNCIAVSSKMRELTESLGPALNASASKAVKSRQWNRTLRKWQRRLQNSQYLPNPGNLFDIGQFSELLKERP